MKSVFQKRIKRENTGITFEYKLAKKKLFPNLNYKHVDIRIIANPKQKEQEESYTKRNQQFKKS